MYDPLMDRHYSSDDSFPYPMYEERVRDGQMFREPIRRVDPTTELIARTSYQLGHARAYGMNAEQKARELKEKLDATQKDLDSAKFYQQRNEERAEGWQKTAENLQKQVSRLKPKKKVTKKKGTK